MIFESTIFLHVLLNIWNSLPNHVVDANVHDNYLRHDYTGCGLTKMLNMIVWRIWPELVVDIGLW